MPAPAQPDAPAAHSESSKVIPLALALLSTCGAVVLHQQAKSPGDEPGTLLLLGCAAALLVGATSDIRSPSASAHWPASCEAVIDLLRNGGQYLPPISSRSTPSTWRSVSARSRRSRARFGGATHGPLSQVRLRSRQRAWSAECRRAGAARSPPTTGPRPWTHSTPSVRSSDRYRRLAERALDFRSTLACAGGCSRRQPIAITLAHLAGNLRSRFTDFLSSDGGQPCGAAATPSSAARQPLWTCWPTGNAPGPSSKLRSPGARPRTGRVRQICDPRRVPHRAAGAAAVGHARRPTAARSCCSRVRRPAAEPVDPARRLGGVQRRPLAR